MHPSRDHDKRCVGGRTHPIVDCETATSSQYDPHHRFHSKARPENISVFVQFISTYRWWTPTSSGKRTKVKITFPAPKSRSKPGHHIKPEFQLSRGSPWQGNYRFAMGTRMLSGSFWVSFWSIGRGLSHKEAWEGHFRWVGQREQRPAPLY